MNKFITLRIALIYTMLITAPDFGYCQSGLVPSPNTMSPFQNRLTLQNDGVNAALTVHRDPLGRQCLDIEAASRKEVINPKIYDHVISVYNKCFATIDLHVCYYHSDHCIDMKIPGSQRKDGILGIYPNLQYFRFSFQEKF